MIAVLGALDGEIAEFLGALADRREDSWAGFPFYRGRLEGREVVVARSGVGKAMAALFTQRLIDVYAPEALVFCGLAGALREGIEIGDTLVAVDCVQHDLDVEALGFLRGEIPYSGLRFLASDPRLVEAASSCVPVSGKVVRGRIVTGDVFVTNRAFSSMRYLRDELSGDAVEMEGAAVGLAAFINKVPFVLIRTISDRADTNARADFKAFLPAASRNSLRFVRHILGGLEGCGFGGL
jgi:adenosylhomocysteine nucleosidase/adenosylhomocysteine/aminodeoxyfutalosine nucleosidase